MDSLSLSIRSARQAAFVALEQFRIDQTWVADSTSELFARHSLSASERGLATELVRGTLRRLGTLDALLGHLVSRPRERVEPELWTILQLGVYQLFFLDGVPAHASVHETVELSRRLGRAGWSGFVNGVLRGAQRLRAAEAVAAEPASDVLPLSPSRWVRLTAPVLADPRQDAARYVSQACSLPMWMAQRYVRQLGLERALSVGLASTDRPRICVRVNTLRSSAGALRDKLTAAGLVVSPDLPAPDVLVVEPSGRVEQWPGFAEGEFAVQDLTSTQAARLLAPQPEEAVWDVCAAPGGKACQLAELMQDRGRVLASDISPARTALIAENARRLGLTIVEPSVMPAEGSPTDWTVSVGQFDAVLVDAPCSNTGVLSRRPEVRWRLQPSEITELSQLQERLLTRSAAHVQPGGRLVYSVCSIEPEEGPALIAGWLTRHREWSLVSQQEYWPGEPSDGGFQCLLRRALGSPSR